MKKRTILFPIFAIALFTVLCIVLKTTPDRLIGAAFCHQLASRSPEHHFPFCYRCCGLFSGITFGMIWYLLICRSRKVFSARALILFAAAFLLFITDILNSTTLLNIDWYPESEKFRLLSAFPIGFFLTGIITPALHYFLSKENRAQGNTIGIFYFLCTWGISYVLIFGNSRILLETARILLCCGSLCFLVLLYCILVHCAAALKHKPCGLKPAIQLAVFAAFLQICLFGTLHILFIPFDVLLQ